MKLPEEIWMDGEDDVSFKWRLDIFEIEIGIGSEVCCVIIWKKSENLPPIVCRDFCLSELIEFIKTDLFKGYF